MQLLGHIAAVFVLCRTLEPIYGSIGILKLIIVAMVFANTFTFITIYFIYAFLVGIGSEHAASILFTPVGGFYAGTAALLVGLKQAIPENEVTLFRFYRCRVSDLAGIYVLSMLALGLVTRSMMQTFILAAYGTFGSWAYLRFFHLRPNTHSKGDPSEHFKFSSFWPSPIRPFLDKIGFVIARYLGLEIALEGSGSTSDVESAYLLPHALKIETSSKDEAEASRRRERGNRALEAKLGENKSAVDDTSAESKLPISRSAQSIQDAVQSNHSIAIVKEGGSTEEEQSILNEA